MKYIKYIRRCKDNECKFLPLLKNNPHSVTHIHCSDVIVIRLAHFLHDLLFCQEARFNRALHCDGPLWVIKSQILQSALRDIHQIITKSTNSQALACKNISLVGSFLLLKSCPSSLTVKWWSWCPCLVRLSSGCDLLCQSNGRRSCCERES